MTEEQLDIARAEEAVRLSRKTGNGCSVVAIAARLAREGWMPPKPEPEVGSVWKCYNGVMGRVMAIVGEVGNEDCPRTVVFFNIKQGWVSNWGAKSWHVYFTQISASEDQTQ